MKNRVSFLRKRQSNYYNKMYSLKNLNKKMTNLKKETNKIKKIVNRK